MNRVQEAICKQGNRPLVGVFVSRYDPVFVEMSGHLGLNICWFDMEHGFMTFSEVADSCCIAAGMGMLSLIRIPDARRENVLKAAECGPDIIDLPMANSPEVVRELVQHARYSPEGNRGGFSASRARLYGLGTVVTEERRRVNRALHLMAQIETEEAANRVDEICSVPGLDAIFLGLTDLSASLGVPGQPDHPSVLAAAEQVIAIAKDHKKLVAAGGASPEMVARLGKGIDMLFCTSDVSSMRNGLTSALQEVRTALG